MLVATVFLSMANFDKTALRGKGSWKELCSKHVSLHFVDDEGVLLDPRA